MFRKIIRMLINPIKPLFWLRHELVNVLENSESVPVPVPVQETGMTIYRNSDERRFPIDI